MHFEKISFVQFLSDVPASFNPADNEYWRDIYAQLTLPQRATSGSAGYDFMAPFDFTLNSGETIFIPTGIRVSMPRDVVFLIVPRSSWGIKWGVSLTNTVGVIDSDYYDADNEGHVRVSLTRAINAGAPLQVSKGDRFCQGIFISYLLTDHDRPEGVRKGGFGSTNKLDK